MRALLEPITNADEPMWLERPLNDPSALPPDLPAGIDRLLSATQRDLSNDLGLDRSKLVCWDEVGELFIVTHSSMVGDGSSGLELTCEDIPWLAHQLFRGEVVEFSSKSELHRSASKEVRF
jgi:hypothetical protein